MAILERRARGTATNCIATSIRLQPEIREQLDELAYARKKSLSVIVEELLEKALSEADGGA